MPFWNHNGIVWFSFFTVFNNTVLVPKKHKKVSIAVKLSNDAPTISKTFLERILSKYEVWSTSTKNAILAIFGENSPLLKIAEKKALQKMFWLH